ncbi:MAG: hypothetical protein KGK11_02445 [Sphingomonadales bacterium]|nr:hypothetical protein [Sphingomonadales bacterium]
MGALGSAWALAQEAPESLLPHEFDQPARPPERKVEPPRAQGVPATPRPEAATVPVAVPEAAASEAAPSVPSATSEAFPHGIAAMTDIEGLPPDKLDQLLGLKPRDDIPPAARRAMLRIGVIARDEGGLPPLSLAHQDPALVRALLAGNKGELVSRWGHVLLRRVLASRLDAPAGYDPAEFTAERGALLLRMGEGDAARALIQDVDPANYNGPLIDAAVDAYVATEDFTGICPVLALNPDARRDGEWQVLKAICESFSGDAAGGLAQLDRLTRAGVLPHFDMLLAQKYAGAAGHARRAVTIEWDTVSDMTPWRYAFALATGLNPPAELLLSDPLRYDEATALAPMLGLGLRADAADRAGGIGLLSSAAMVDLYSQIYADDAVRGDAADRALLLHDAYLGDSPEARLDAMRQLWNGAAGPLQRYAREVLTAYAAARLAPGAGAAKDAGDLIAAMLAAGLDGNAMRWAGLVPTGSQGWALLALAAPAPRAPVGSGGLDAFEKQDGSDNARKSGFLLAGLAGLGRVTPAVESGFAGKLGIDLAAPTRWTRAIDRAAELGNPTLVALLAGLGMQGDGWDRMTPRYLYHIVGALHRVGLDGEARMIAAEAVARG